MALVVIVIASIGVYLLSMAPGYHTIEEWLILDRYVHYGLLVIVGVGSASIFRLRGSR